MTKVFINNHYPMPDKLRMNPLCKEVLDNQIQVVHPFELVSQPEDADFCVLPSIWNYYVNNNEIQIAAEIKREAEEAGKRLILFSSGDYTANFPFHNSIVIQSSCFKSRNGLNGNIYFSIPTFITDYAEMYCDSNVQIRNKTSLPIVGFCGQANGSFVDFTRRQISITCKQMLYRLHLLKWEPPTVEPTLFRRNILNKIEGNNNLTTNFLLRTKYRAGYRPATPAKDPFHPTRVEYIHNILDSDYTVCIRGAGNFSVRFYETLSLGRIPIFINTDCILPLEGLIDYKKYMIWVEQDEIPYLAEKIIDFHKSLTNDQFIELQYGCRTLWKNYLTQDGFFAHLSATLPSEIANPI